MNPSEFTIVSGGQTGADRAALDWAIQSGVPHGGWCPKGRKAEDGPIPERYKLRETAKDDYVERTELNVRDSDVTVVFTVNAEATGGSRKTIEYLRKYNKPCLHLSQARHGQDASGLLRAFLRQYQPKVMNVAGSRASKEPGVAGFVFQTLQNALNT